MIVTKNEDDAKHYIIVLKKKESIAWKALPIKMRRTPWQKKRHGRNNLQDKQESLTRQMSAISAGTKQYNG